ncbi:hypothetical protein DB346_04975 [Verrucomicrobia bacterium LW23]|nr:hypothetical protein DB346_04975 [Verrucomicrobia bacterium LW23]
MKLEVIRMLPEKRADRPALLFVHGAWQSAWIWQHLWMPYFVSYGYPCYAISLRGHGQSEGAERVRNTTLMEYAGDVLRVMSQMDEVPVLVGHDMGAYVCLKALESLSAPGAALLAPVPLYGSQFKTLMRNAMKRHWWATVRAGLSGRALEFVKTPGVWRDLAFAPDTPPDIAANTALRLQEESHAVMRDLSGRVPIYKDRIRTPILVMGGTEDRLTPMESVAEVARSLDVPCERMPRMGHCLMMEPRWREAAVRLQDWLEGRIPLRNPMGSRAGHTIEPVPIDLDLGEDDADASEYGYDGDPEDTLAEGEMADLPARERTERDQVIDAEDVTFTQGKTPAPAVIESADASAEPEAPELQARMEGDAAEPGDVPEEEKKASEINASTNAPATSAEEAAPVSNADQPADAPQIPDNGHGMTKPPRAQVLPKALGVSGSTVPQENFSRRPATQRIVMTPLMHNRTPVPGADRYRTLPSDHLPERIHRTPQKRATTANGTSR